MKFSSIKISRACEHGKVDDVNNRAFSVVLIYVVNSDPKKPEDGDYNGARKDTKEIKRRNRRLVRFDSRNWPEIH